MPIGIKFSNFAFSTLAVGCNSTATSLALASGTGAKFPTLAAGEYFYATLENASLDREVVKVTARSTDAITVVRGQDNTTARSWNAGDSIALRLNAGALNDFKTEVVDATNLIRTSNNTFTGTNTFTGATNFDQAPTLDAPLAVASGGTSAATAAAAFDNLKQAATDTYAGVVELATAGEATAGTGSTRALTPSTLRAGLNAAGTAPVFAPRAWVNFNGTLAANITGTYTRAGTTVTVTTGVAHGHVVGHRVYLDFTSGAAGDLAATVTSVADAYTFTITHTASGTTSGNVTINRRAIIGAGNVSNVAYLATGTFAVNFTAALDDTAHCAVVSAASISFVGTSTANRTASSTTVLTHDTASVTANVADVNVVVFR